MDILITGCVTQTVGQIHTHAGEHARIHTLTHTHTDALTSFHVHTSSPTHICVHTHYPSYMITHTHQSLPKSSDSLFSQKGGCMLQVRSS